MLFNSYGFIFVFLPLALFGYFQLARIGPQYAAGFLTLASLVFYGYWAPAYVLLLVGSFTANYGFGMWIARSRARGGPAAGRVLVLAVAANLLLLAYFKYAMLLLSSVNALAGTHLPLRQIVLPLGISFFTFTQIAFLVDVCQGKVRDAAVRAANDLSIQ
jgi:D-alanyl-lipoteichoic acid acyltransferase DltB (MBOAT superfamily)